MNDLPSVLESIAKAADAAGSIPGPAGVVAKITSIAMGTAAKIARRGGDPVIEIQRLHSSAEKLAEVEGDWSSALDKKFGLEEQ